MICQDDFWKDLDMFFGKKGNFNRHKRKQALKKEVFYSFEVSSDTPEYSWFLASNP